MALSPLEAAGQRVVLQPVLANLAAPLYVTHARDGTDRLFIVEQRGVIKVRHPGGAGPSVFLDIGPRVLDGGERGLLGLAFHPHYSQNGRFFVNYTRRPDGATVIAEYRVSVADPNVAALDEVSLLVIPQPFANHNGGMIEFGPDGLLYIGMGDGGNAFDPRNRAQDPMTLLGKILRIDVDASVGVPPFYASPPSNPFAGPALGLDEIFAVGLRNPWRFSFDRATGGLYVGDVGQDEREEIDLVTIGGNYGWRVLEGTRCTGLDPGCADPTFVPPIAEYAHSGGRCAVTGGYAYRGNAGTLPAGAYVFADLCSGEIFLREGEIVRALLPTTLSIASFGEDESGELYVVDLGGAVYRLVNPDAPRLTLRLNDTVLHAGETLRVGLDVHTGETAVTGDAYFGIVFPDGQTTIFFTSVTPPGGLMARLADDARTFAPLIPGVVVDSGTSVRLDDFLVLTLAGAELPGTYFVFAALARPGAFDDGRRDPGDLLALALEAVAVNP
ncbi:MAG: PQQ-dependent sugar dehydrogenase [Candidatus Rokuibacteriota bacterium]